MNLEALWTERERAIAEIDNALARANYFKGWLARIDYEIEQAANLTGDDSGDNGSDDATEADSSSSGKQSAA